MSQSEVLKQMMYLRDKGDDQYYTPSQIRSMLIKESTVCHSIRRLEAIIAKLYIFGFLEIPPKTTIIDKWRYRAVK